MMKHSHWFVISGLVVSTCFADVDLSKSTTLKAVDSLIKSQADIKKPSEPQSMWAKAKAIVQQVASSVETNKKVTELQSELFDLKEENEKLATIPAVVANEHQKLVGDDIKKQDTILQQANNFSHQSVVSPNLANADLEEACRANVDLGSLKVSADDVSRNSYATSEMKRISRDDKSRLEKAEDMAALNAARALKDLAAEDDKRDEEEMRPGLRFLDDNARIEHLKSQVAKEKREKDDRWDEVYEVLTKATKDLRKYNRAKADVSDLASFAADDVLNRINRVRQVGIDNAKALRNACVKQAQVLGKDNPQQGGLIASAMQLMQLWNAQYATGSFMVMLQKVAQGLTCPDVSSSLDGLWTPVISAAEALRGATDPIVLGESFVKLNNAVATAQSQVDKKLRPAVDGCNFAARNRKKVEQFVGQLASAIQSNPSVAQRAGLGGIPQGRPQQLLGPQHQ